MFSSYRNRWIAMLAACAALALLPGCGGGGGSSGECCTSSPSAGSAGSSGGAGTSGTSTPTTLSTWTSAQRYSVGAADATFNSASGEIVLATTASSAQAVGRFLGGGNGHKAIFGAPLGTYHRLALAQLNRIEWDARSVSQAAGYGGIYLNFNVDLDCSLDENPSTDSIATWRARRKLLILQIVTPDFSPFYAAQALTAIPAPVDLGGGWYRFSVAANDLAWQQVIDNPPLAGHLPHSSATFTRGRLTDFVAAFPNACLVDGLYPDGGMARNLTDPVCDTGASLMGAATQAITPARCGIALPAIMFMTGDSGNVAPTEYRVRRIRVNDTTFQ